MAHYVHIHCVYMRCVYIHSLFIYSSIDGYGGCFYLSATVSNAAVDMVVHISVWIPASVLLRTYPEMELLDYMIILFLIFWGATNHTVFHSGCGNIPTSSAQWFQLFHILNQHLFSGCFLFFFFLFWTTEYSTWKRKVNLIMLEKELLTFLNAFLWLIKTIPIIK